MEEDVFEDGKLVIVEFKEGISFYLFLFSSKFEDVFESGNGENGGDDEDVEEG